MIPTGTSAQQLDTPNSFTAVDDIYIDFEQGIYKVNGVDVAVDTLLSGTDGYIYTNGLTPITAVNAIGPLFNSIRNGTVNGCELFMEFEMNTGGSAYGNLLLWHLDNTDDWPFYSINAYGSVYNGITIEDEGSIYPRTYWDFDAPSRYQMFSITDNVAMVGNSSTRDVLIRCGFLLGIRSTVAPQSPYYLASLNGDNAYEPDDIPYSIDANRIKRIGIASAAWEDNSLKKWSIKRLHVRPTTLTKETFADFAPMTVIGYDPKRPSNVDGVSYDSSGKPTYSFGPFTLDEAPAANRLVVAVVTFKKHATLGTTTTALSVKFDGVDAECVASNGEIEFWQLVVPTGTTIDEVAVAFTDYRQFCTVRLVSFLTDNPVPYEARGASAAAATVTIPNMPVVAGGMMIASMKAPSIFGDASWGWDDGADDQLWASVNIDGYIISTQTLVPLATSSANTLYANEMAATATEISVVAVFWLPPAASVTDPYWSSVKLMLGFDGADAATTFTAEESTPHALTFVGNAQLDTADKKFGTASLLLDGTGDYVTTPDSADWDISNQPFTAEAHVKFTNTTTQVIIAQWTNTGTIRSWDLERSNTGLLNFWISTNGTTGTLHVSAAGGFVNNVWYHVRISFDGATYRMYVNGVMIASNTTVLTAFNAATVLSVGAKGNGAEPFSGWIDEVRFTKGVARNSGLTRFKPPTASFPRT